MKEIEWRVSGLTLGAGILAYLTWTVWRDSASRVALFVCVATLVVAAMDVVWATVTTRRTQVTVTANPAELFAGDRTQVELDIAGPRRRVAVRLETLPAGLEFSPAEVPSRAPYTGVAGVRALHREITVEVQGFGLAGLLTVLRRHTVPLARPLGVGPRPVAAAQPLPDLFRSSGDGEPRPSHAGDVVRGVRAYVPGDPVRRIHWRATARTGELVVKEVDETGSPRLTIALDLGGGGIGGEQAAGRAAWYALEGLRRGYAVALLTVERRETVAGPVTSQSDIIRRLAAATAPGAPDLAAADLAAADLAGAATAGAPPLSPAPSPGAGADLPAPPAADAADPTAQPAARPAAHPAAHPTANPAAGPAAQPAAHPAAHPAARPAAQPAAQPAARPAAHPGRGSVLLVTPGGDSWR